LFIGFVSDTTEDCVVVSGGGGGNNIGNGNNGSSVSMKPHLLFEKMFAFPNLRKIALQSCKGLSDAFVDKMVRKYYRQLEYLDLSRNSKNSKLTSKSLYTICSICLRLKYLSIASCEQMLINGSLPVDIIFPSGLKVLDISNIASFGWSHLFALIHRAPQLTTIYANHLSSNKFYNTQKFGDLSNFYSMHIAKVMFEEAIILERAESIIQSMFNILHEQYPSMNVIERCLLAGHYKIMPLLNAIHFPINSIPVDIVNKIIDLGHSQILIKLRISNYCHFNEISDKTLHEMIRRGDSDCMVQLRLANLDRSRWENIPIDVVVHAIRNNRKNAIKQLYELQLPSLDKFKSIDIEHIHEVIKRGFSGVLKIILNSGYEHASKIDARIVLESAYEDGNIGILSCLKNFYFEKYEEVRRMEKQLLLECNSPITPSAINSIFNQKTAGGIKQHEETNKNKKKKTKCKRSRK
jgi:hypothetical protein